MIGRKGFGKKRVATCLPVGSCVGVGAHSEVILSSKVYDGIFKL